MAVRKAVYLIVMLSMFCASESGFAQRNKDKTLASHKTKAVASPKKEAVQLPKKPAKQELAVKEVAVQHAVVNAGIGDSLRSVTTRVAELEGQLKDLTDGRGKITESAISFSAWTVHLAMSLLCLILAILISWGITHSMIGKMGKSSSNRLRQSGEGTFGTYSIPPPLKQSGSEQRSSFTDRDAFSEAERKKLRQLLDMLSPETVRQLLQPAEQIKVESVKRDHELAAPSQANAAPSKYFLAAPTNDKKFFDKNKKTSFDPLKSLYVLEIDPEGDRGNFYLATDPVAVQRALESEETIIKPVCEKTEDSVLYGRRSIQNVEKGSVAKKGEMWHVEKMAKIRIT